MNLLIVTACLLFNMFQNPATSQASPSGKAEIFTEVWVWHFQHSSDSGAIAVYRQPGSGNWLFTSEAYGTSGEMIDWILAKPNGSYTLAYTDEHGKKSAAAYQSANDLPALPDTVYQATGITKLFGRNDLGFPVIEGLQYKVQYQKTNDSSSLFLARVNADLSAIYNFNRLPVEVRLPIHFPNNIPGSFLYLQEHSRLSGGYQLNHSFQYISETIYEIYPAAYGL